MPYATITKGQTKRMRWIPEGAVTTMENGLGVVYIYSAAEKTFAVGYAGAAGKNSFHYRFKSAEQAEAHGQKFLDGLKQREALMSERRESAKAAHTIPVGAIIYNSWGYDQTNIDWYKVVAVSANYVSLQRIPGVDVPDQGIGPMSGRTKPDVNADPKGEIVKHRANAQNYVRFEHGAGSVWDGERALYYSWYA